MYVTQDKRQILDLYRDNAAVEAAIVERRISLGSAEADRQRIAYYRAKNSELLAIIRTWDW
jgi:hypothetical protein